VLLFFWFHLWPSLSCLDGKVLECGPQKKRTISPLAEPVRYSSLLAYKRSPVVTITRTTATSMPPNGMLGPVRVDKYVCVVLCMAAAYTRLEHESEAKNDISTKRNKLFICYRNQTYPAWSIRNNRVLARIRWLMQVDSSSSTSTSCPRGFRIATIAPANKNRKPSYSSVFD